ncbi:MAG: hypothetical protein P4L84_29910 [Isosphaeraceae bacterium]|nr:hypothetical protein [Isosphaeraceae bacterium]
MNHDGVRASYLRACVPPEVEAAWLEELKRDKLQLLSQEGNWKVLDFLKTHRDFGHLADLVQADPKGDLWMRCAFLESLLTYTSDARKAGGDPLLVTRAVRKVIADAERLLKRARSARSIGRVQDILDQARDLQGEIEMG